MSGPNLINPDTELSSLFGCWPETVAVFLSHGMFCFGCPIAPFHTVIDACTEYTLDRDVFCEELRAAISGRGQ